MTKTVDFAQLLQHIADSKAAVATGERLLIAIAGAPGKSTLAERLVNAINADAVATTNSSQLAPAVVIPMDGFHLDNRILDARSHLSRKGAAHTFDVSGFHALLQRLAAPCAPVSRLDQSSGSTDDVHSQSIYVPLFDREMDVSRNAAQAVESQHQLLVVEGNYLLLDQPGWRELASLFHLTIMLQVPFEELERRLIKRWLDHGLDEQAARQRALSNDIPNAAVVVNESFSAHLEIHSG